MFLFNRLTPKISLIISILSLSVGIAIPLIKDPKLWYIPAIFSVPAILLLNFSIRRWRPIPMRQSCFLSKILACQMLYKAVSLNPIENNFCWHLTITHANGTAIAASTAETMNSTIEHLNDMILGRSGNISREKLCTPGKMKFHLDRLRRIEAMISGVTTEEHFVNKSYRQIDDGDKVYDLLTKCSNSFDDNIIDKMDSFCTKVPPEVDDELENYYLHSLEDSGLSQEALKWKNSIERVMKQEITAELSDILEKYLSPAGKLAKKILDNTRTDWFNDLKFVWNDPICKTT